MPSGENQANPPEQQESVTADPVREILSELSALRQFAQHYLVALADETKATLRKTALTLVAILAACLLLIVFAVASVIYLVQGMDGALVAMTGREWMGHLLTGFLGLGLLGSAGYGWLVRQDYVRQQKKAAKYEKRRVRQRESIGTDVAETAAQSFA